MPRSSQLRRWVRDGHDPLAAALRRAATSAVGTYGAYVAYGLLHPALCRPDEGSESTEALPGDELVELPDRTKTFAIDIDAPREAVWPFLMQMGYGRGGWYGWYPMENAGRGSSEDVVEALQDLAIGDLVPDGPDADRGLGVWRVVELTAPEKLVLYSRRVAVDGREVAPLAMVHEPTIECSWTFLLRPTLLGCRLIVRVRVRFEAVGEGIVGRLLRQVFDLGDTVMERTMLAGIKRRAEHHAGVPPADEADAASC